MPATTKKFRLYCGRDCDGMIRKLEDATTNNKAVSSLEIRETTLEDDVINSIVDLLSTGSIKTIHLENCSAHLNHSVLRLVQALGNCRDVRLSESTFLSKFFLETFLESAKQLKNLRIRDHLLVDQVEALSRGLTSNRMLHTLDLSRSRIDDFSVLAEGLRSGCARRLKLRSIGLQDHHLVTLMNALLPSSSSSSHSALESLDLSFNRLRNLKCIGEFLRHRNCRLKELMIGYQNLWQPSRRGVKNIDVSEIAAALIETGTTDGGGARLATLNLPRNELDDSDALLFAAVLRCERSALEVLDLRENGISDAGVEALAESARWSRGLRQLHLRGNRFGTRASRALLAAASTNFGLAVLADSGRGGEDEDIHREIRYQTALNVGGRLLLRRRNDEQHDGESSCPPSLALWPLVLEKLTLRLDGEGIDDKPPAANRFEESLRIDVLHYLLKSCPAIFGRERIQTEPHRAEFRVKREDFRTDRGDLSTGGQLRRRYGRGDEFFDRKAYPNATRA
eukprot:CAMPEP_0197182090 /NCGR_PEP_ID=MMETSP1423-20130617/6170_1 /TAXON_ID=476441 /ORGANISM="Pseudo-nitzschia heimii, Strain UNC1101" /LENGTH=509 /DNA_ID=CAMNT_0042632461 /DNA_START=94 /DNA_END=1620 /DNA_ORIENTATION=-